MTLKDPPISQPDAWALLGELAGKVAEQITKASKVALTQGQLDAMTSFAYNAGVGALTASTLWRKLQAGDVAGAAAEFPRWIHGGGRVLPGLVTRRAEEQKLFTGAAA